MTRNNGYNGSCALFDYHIFHSKIGYLLSAHEDFVTLTYLTLALYKSLKTNFYSKLNALLFYVILKYFDVIFWYLLMTVDIN